jgi:hypothetical protein
MKPLAFAFLMLASEVAGAGEILDQLIRSNRSLDITAPVDGPTFAPDAAIELDPIAVYAQDDLFGPNIKGLREAMPCLGCDGKRFSQPFLLQVGVGIGLFAARPFFQQPRVRGEANDEAAYYALRMAQCLDDSPGCLDRQPNSGLYNWQPSERVEDDWTLHESNRSFGVAD